MEPQQQQRTGECFMHWTAFASRALQQHVMQGGSLEELLWWWGVQVLYQVGLRNGGGMGVG
jgi:hypothetical protein